MTLIDDFKTKFPKLWSVRLNVLSVLLQICEVFNTFGPIFVPSLEPLVHPGIFAIIGILLGCSSLIARAIKQYWPELETTDETPNP